MDSFDDENRRPANIATKPTADNQSSSSSYDSREPSVMARSFVKGGALVFPPDRDNFIGFRPHYIFLYGTLMDPEQLQKVLRLKSRPTLQPASIVGWKIRLWGQYPALVNKPGNNIHGKAYNVEKVSHMECLKYYETDAYMIKECNIILDNGTEVPGETFIFNGDKSLLKDGSFDLKDWQIEQLEEKLRRDSLAQEQKYSKQ